MKINPTEPSLASHGDVIKKRAGALLGIPLDLLMRFEIHPALVSVVETAGCGVSVLAVNLPAEAAGTCPRDSQSQPAVL